MDQERFHLYNKIEIIYRCHPQCVPEFTSLHEGSDLENIYQLALERVKQATSTQERILNKIIWLCQAVEENCDESCLAFLSPFISNNVWCVLGDHLTRLESLEERSVEEEEIYQLCLEILKQPKEQLQPSFLSLLRRYISLLGEGHVRLPLMSIKEQVGATNSCLLF